MQVAIFVSSDKFVAWSKGKKGFRSIPGIEDFAFSTLLSEEINPLDIVLRHHWMGYAANFNSDEIAFDCDNRYVFFFSSIDGVGY